MKQLENVNIDLKKWVRKQMYQPSSVETKF